MAFTTDATPPPESQQGSDTPPVGEGGQGQGFDSQQGQPTEQQPDYSLASDFLQRVPEADRSIVEKYVRQWDAGVTRRFQDLHNQYQPYQQLGDVEQLQQAVAVMRLLDEDPAVIYNILMDDVQKGAEWAQALGNAGQQAQMQPGVAPVEGQQFQGLPPEFQQQWEQQQNILQSLAQIVLSNQQMSQAAAEDAELDSYLQNLHDEFGDFDEDYVLARMERGEDGGQAVQAFRNMVQAQINAAYQAQQGLPPVVLSGQGAPPQEQQTVASLDKKQTRNLVAELMAGVNGQGN